MSLFPRTLFAASFAALALALGLAPSPGARGAESGADAGSEKKTVMTVRGKLLLRDALDQPLSRDWRTAKGKWEVVDGATRGSELPADHHGAVTRHPLKFRNAVIQYSFKLDGAKATSLSLNDAKGHVCRVLITPRGFSVRKDDHDRDGPDKAAILKASNAPIEPGRWHTLLVEIQGSEMLARIDDERVAVGSNDGIDIDKGDFGLTVSGESVSFKDLSIWEARPNPEWPANRAKLASTSR